MYNLQVMNTILPKISVIMAVYNGADYLQTSIESIVQQTYSNFEFIIIDDASIDNTWSILEEYARIDSRIVLVKNTSNNGLTKSLNAGLRIARGEYIARQDADDISTPDRFLKQVQVLDADIDTILVSGNFDIIDENGEQLQQERREVAPVLVAWYQLFYNYLTPHSLVMFRREPALKIGGYQESYKYAQDYELWLRLLDLGKALILPDTLLQLRVHKTNISSLHSKTQFTYAISASQQKLGELTGTVFQTRETEMLSDFWRAQKLPARYNLIDFNQKLEVIYRAFLEYKNASQSAWLIRRAISESYIDCAKFLPSPIDDLLISYYAFRWHPFPVLKYWPRNIFPWIKHLFLALARRVSA